MKKILVLLLALATWSSCCKKKVLVPLKKGVYVAGGVNTTVGVTAKVQAVYWYNQVIKLIGDTLVNAYANCITHQGNNLYIGGHEIDGQGTMHAVYWRNDTVVKVSDVTGASSIVDIAVVGQDVYLFGYVGGTGAGDKQLCYWKNGVLSMQGLWTAGRISVADNKVYCCATERVGSKSYGVIWQDKVQQQRLADCSFTDIKLANGHYYVSGSVFNGDSANAAYWEENSISPTLLPNLHWKGYGHSIELNGTEVYVAGVSLDPSIWTAYSVIWKNGNASQISASQGYGEVMAMKLVGSTLYACGTVTNSSYSAAAYWNNGERTLMDPNRMYTQCSARHRLCRIIQT
jgi:hypothetical protein